MLKLTEQFYVKNKCLHTEEFITSLVGVLFIKLNLINGVFEFSGIVLLLYIC